ncbi:MAG: hypothetical protein HN457_07515 [Opitutales bacterium]|jgi:hypothetical protein|nr:hypothetical protein [Opitutales bacterium]MBT5167269.1 hypothetical protein [Opitutales bacterium]MBT5816005.1 hypothetical protein [Opitutales bacterium]MBT6379687.1 hypothetical protein [Opitutales bacterium]MBT6768584.1 hypothetical protein [Opitutales bacterium]
MIEEQQPPPYPKLKWILSAIFLFALIMGPGPGLYLINDFAAAGGTLAGVPALYAWAVFWFVVEAGVVITAYRTIWRDLLE